MSGTRPPTHLGIVASLAPATGMHNQRTVELVLDCDEGNHALALRLADTFERLGYRYYLFDQVDFLSFSQFLFHGQLLLV